MPRTINFLGSVALLVSSITGPSLVIIPLLFQQAGWLTPVLTFTAIGILSGAAALFLVEAMSSIEGNEAFQASIEFTTIAHLFLGKRWHIVVQILLYLAMETLVVASLLESFQSMDVFLINVAHKTCAISFTEGWVCVDQIQQNANSAFSGYILGSFGTLITICLILPLSLVHLVDNIIFQVVSFIVLIMITIVWIVICALKGLQTNTISVAGSNQSMVAGFVLSNFSFVTTIPAWVNNTHPSVNIRRAVWLSVLISCLIYIPIGWMGSLAFSFPNSQTLLQVFGGDIGHSPLSTVARVSSYIFPLAVLITSVPVFVIVVRYNLLRGNVCSKGMAIFLSAILPWLVTIPFQTNGALSTILNWASLIFTSPSNLIVPFVLFILSKRNFASAMLDANVSIEMPPVCEVGPPATPVRRSTSTGGAMTPPIPVLIITDATDKEPNGQGDAKTLVSSESTEAERPALTIQMPIRNRVLSPSRHRYYGQESVGEYSDSPTNANEAELPPNAPESKTPGETRSGRRASSLRSHSILHSSSTGMDEFLLMSPTSPHSTGLGSMDGTLSPEPLSSSDAPSPPDIHHSRQSTGSRTDDVRISMVLSPSVGTNPQIPVLRAFKAFPGLSATSVLRPTRMSAVGCGVATALVLTAIIYDIVAAVRGN